MSRLFRFFFAVFLKQHRVGGWGEEAGFCGISGPLPLQGLAGHLPPAVDLFGTLYIRLCKEFGLQEPVYENNGDFRVTIMRPGKESDNQASGGVTTTKTTEKTTEKTPEKILETLRRNPDATTQMLAEQVGITVDGVYWHMKKLKAQGKIRRIGGDRGGHWEVL